MTSTLSTKLILFAAIIGIAYSVGIYEQCAGEGYGTFPCAAGLGCFRRNKWYSSCQPSCPKNVGWECEFAVGPPATIAAGWDQCGGDGWVGPRVCAAGFACFARSVYYSQCRPINDCPAGWACGAFVPVTAAPTVPIVLVNATAIPIVLVNATAVPTSAGPFVVAAYSQCNVAGAICAAGTGCFRNTALYSECRPACPPTWACQTDVAANGEQCGGEGYVGLTRCAEGLRCYARSKWYSQCAVSCPGGDWAC
uniref:Predicted protein n=1 Tax=Hordeum vulgare subsp. vulgare TaxID=112509 RepID=F2E407_HORVV|nr:predicted protein [Hordeum vulgare subsp. vulgare]